MKRLRMILCRLFAALVTLVLLIGGAIGIENWTGARALAAAKLKLAQAGETLDFAALLPNPVPDEVNFCALPAFVGIVEPWKESDKSEGAANHAALHKLNWLSAVGTVRSLPPLPRLTDGCTRALGLDVTVAAKFLVSAGYIDTTESADAAAILAAVDRLHPLLKELSDAAPSRPEAVLTFAAGAGDLRQPALESRAYLTSFKKAAQGLTLRSQVAAAAGDAESALRSILALHRLHGAVAGDPAVLSLLVADDFATLELNSIWALLHGAEVQEAQLARLQKELEHVDYLRQALRALRGELAMLVDHAAWHRDRRPERMQAYAAGRAFLEMRKVNGWDLALAQANSAGWWDHSAARVIELHGTYIREPVIAGDVMTIMCRLEELQALLSEQRGAQYSTLAALTLPSGCGLRDVILTEVVRRQAVIAVALERHRRVHGRLPSSLAELVPAFLSSIPHDPAAKEKIRYRVEEGNAFTLWSIGFDGRNDHGILPEGRAAGRLAMPDYRGDWVWRSRL